METILDHVFEPEIAGSPPRRASLPGSTTGLLMLAFAVLLLFLVGGSRALWEAAHFAWLTAHGLVKPQPFGKLFSLVLLGGTVVGVTLWLMARIALWHHSRLRLLQRGVATVGTILHKQADADNSLRYYLRYGYAREDVRHEREEEVTGEQWKRFEVGQSVTVLYDPERPSHATLYRLIGTK